jgi:uncharacterized protein YraI
MRNFILGLSLSAMFIVGCLVGSGRSSDTVPAVKAAPAGQRYAYYCLEESNAVDLNKFAKKMGRAGWHLAAAAGGRGPGLGPNHYMWCFEKRF